MGFWYRGCCVDGFHSMTCEWATAVEMSMMERRRKMEVPLVRAAEFINCIRVRAGGAIYRK